jgi:ribonuclease-3
MFYGQNGKSLSLIQKNIGYFFDDERLLINALVHSSFAHEYKDAPISHNERLEFLGDAVLNLIICHYLMNKYPGYREGNLSALKSYLVSEVVLARVAQGINLGDYLLLGKGEEQTQGRKKSSLLADALEALIAAVYLDGGLEPARLFVINQFSDQLEKAHAQRRLPDYKSLLQEYTQARFNCRPKYELVNQQGPAHKRIFEVKLSVNNQVWARGCGRSKKEAETEAARKAIEGEYRAVVSLKGT